MKRVLWLTALLGLLGSACSVHKPISAVMMDPGRYARRPVTIAGTVARSYGVWQYGAYELKDDTGSVWVITHRPTPVRGTHVKATGRTLNAFTLPFVPFQGTVFQEEHR